jgi:hypothetical protein
VNMTKIEKILCHDVLRKIMEQIASDKRNTRHKILAKSTLTFLDTQLQEKRERNLRKAKP